MKTNHTSGVWSVHALPDGTEYGHRVTAEGLMICDVSYQLLRKNKASERIANARLIAASPDLLEALQNALGVLDAFSTQSQTAMICAQMAREAISKALGEMDED